MIEIRTFEGEPDELAEFTVRVWRKTYEGKMLITLWSEPFFRRELFDQADGREFLIAAYDGRRLVGSHPSRALRVRLCGEEIRATWGSFITVDPEYRRQGVALGMQREWARRHLDRGARVNFGFQYIRSPFACGPKFWLQQPDRFPIIRKLRLLFRPIDHAAVSRFELHNFEAYGAKLLSTIQRKPSPPRNQSDIRLCRKADLRGCLELVEQAGKSADLAYLFGPGELERLLHCNQLSETVVLERQGTAAGFVNYCLLEILGRQVLRVAQIDLIAFGTLPRYDRRRLLKAALSRAADAGAQAAVVLWGSSYALAELLATGFMPGPREYYYIAAPMEKGIRFDNIRSLQVLLR